MKKVRCFMVGVCFFMAGGMGLGDVWAQKIDLGPIVIRSSRVIEDPSSLEAVSLDADELDNRGISSLGDALQEVQGVDVYSSSSVSSLGAVSIRGADSSYTQVMYNGIKLFDPIVTSRYFYGYRALPLSSFEKVEVLKGPYSVLYGAGGIGGNIHLTSKRGQGDPTWTYRQEIGSYQTFQETLKFEGEVGKLDFAFHATRADVGSMYEARYKDGNHETDPLGLTSFGGRLDYDVSDAVTIGAMGDYVVSRYEYDAYGASDSDGNVQTHYQGVGSLYLEHKVSEEFRQKFTLGGNRIYRKGNSGSDFWYDGVTQQLKYDGIWEPVSWDRISFGADFLEEKGEYFDYTYMPKKRSITKGIFLQNLIEPVKGTRVITGVRGEDHSTFGDHTTYSVRGEQDVFEGGTIYSSYGTGFKAPSIYQLYDPTYGSIDLDPESSKSFELGYDHHMDKLSFGQAFFWTDIDDMINWSVGGYENEGQVKLRGLEVYTQYNFAEKAFVRGEYTFTDTEKKSTGARLARRPKNKLKLIAEVPWNKFTFRGDIAYIGNRIDSSEKLKAYYLANFSTEYQVNEDVQTFVRIENVLDKEYETADGYETKDCSVYGGFEVKF